MEHEICFFNSTENEKKKKKMRIKRSEREESVEKEKEEEKLTWKLEFERVDGEEVAGAHVGTMMQCLTVRQE